MSNIGAEFEIAGAGDDGNIIEGWYTITCKDLVAAQGGSATAAILSNLDTLKKDETADLAFRAG